MTTSAPRAVDVAQRVAEVRVAVRDRRAQHADVAARVDGGGVADGAVGDDAVAQRQRPADVDRSDRVVGRLCVRDDLDVVEHELRGEASASIAGASFVVAPLCTTRTRVSVSFAKRLRSAAEVALAGVASIVRPSIAIVPVPTAPSWIIGASAPPRKGWSRRCPRRAASRRFGLTGRGDDLVERAGSEVDDVRAGRPARGEQRGGQRAGRGGRRARRGRRAAGRGVQLGGVGADAGSRGRRRAARPRRGGGGDGSRCADDRGSIGANPALARRCRNCAPLGQLRHRTARTASRTPQARGRRRGSAHRQAARHGAGGVAGRVARAHAHAEVRLAQQADALGLQRHAVGALAALDPYRVGGDVALALAPETVIVTVAFSESVKRSEAFRRRAIRRARAHLRQRRPVRSRAAPEAEGGVVP